MINLTFHEAMQIKETLEEIQSTTELQRYSIDNINYILDMLDFKLGVEEDEDEPRSRTREDDYEG